MNELDTQIVLGAPDAELAWLELVISALQELRPAYHTDSRGVLRLHRAMAVFQWDRINRQFYANLIDGQNSGSVISGVISGIDPDAQGIDEAADFIHARFVHFVNRMRAKEHE